VVGQRKRESGRLLPCRISLVLAAAVLALLLTGCARRCSFCGRRTLFFDQVHLHGVELTVCPDCQYW